MQLLKFIVKLLLMVNINSLSVPHEYQETLKGSVLQSLKFLLPKLREYPSENGLIELSMGEVAVAGLLSCQWKYLRSLTSSSFELHR